MPRNLLFFIVFLISTENLFAQPLGFVKGIVKNKMNVPMGYVTVMLDGTSIATQTDENGRFTISATSGNYTLIISSIGYGTIKKEIEIFSGSTAEIETQTLEEYSKELNEVAVNGEKESEKLRQSGFQVTSVEAKKFVNLSMDVNAVLGQVAGIRIREEGGLGSNFNFFLNGLSGRQVKFFIDGQPLENYGSLFNLNNVPVNLIERVDIYKGVVPIHLGSDALGGAINIVTNQKINNFLDASYSYGSFNTHRAALNGRWRNEATGLTVGLQSFYNFSNNNYTMRNVETIENNRFVSGDFKRFHNDYQSYLGNIELGITGKKWADALLFGVGYGEVESQIQTASQGSKNQSGSFTLPVSGEATTSEVNHRVSMRYRKDDFFLNGLSLNHYSAYHTLSSLSVDTSSKVYNWKGDVIFSNNNSSGELSSQKTVFRYDQRMFIQTTGLVYDLSKMHQLSASFTYSYIERIGQDIRRRSFDINTFEKPNTLSKGVFGAAYRNSLLDGRLQTTIFGKYYGLGILARESRSYQFGQFSLEDLRTNTQNYGYGIATRYMLIPEIWIVKASYEKAYRIPEAVEIFGDGLLILANPKLKPENSHNVNIGTIYNWALGNNRVLKADISGFYRQTNDMIFPSSGGRFISYINQQNILIRGMEAECRYKSKKLTAGVNATYQDVLNNQEYLSGTNDVPNIVYRQRMYNTPYFFANADIGYGVEKISTYKWAVMFSYNTNYVQEFYLNYPSIALGGPKFTVPTQFLHHVAVTLSDVNQRYNLTLECRNLTDANAYDNFALQKPGRAFYVKMRYFIK